MPFAIKTSVHAIEETEFHLVAQKTMYGGKAVAAGDLVYIFASEASGGRGLVARGIVRSAEAVPRIPGVARQTPRVSVVVRRVGDARRQLGRGELKAFAGWKDERPETELNFKLYRQSTNKLVGLTKGASRFLDGFF